MREKKNVFHLVYQWVYIFLSCQSKYDGHRSGEWWCNHPGIISTSQRHEDKNQSNIRLKSQTILSSFYKIAVRYPSIDTSVILAIWRINSALQTSSEAIGKHNFQQFCLEWNGFSLLFNIFHAFFCSNESRWNEILESYPVPIRVYHNIWSSIWSFCIYIYICSWHS